VTSLEQVGVIGDVHGCHTDLARLIKAISGEVTQLVFVGDLVNRGPASRQVLDLCVDLSDRQQARFVRGNHDEEFLRYIETGDLPRFLAYGGASTLRSYFDRFQGADLSRLHFLIPARHVELLRSMVSAVVVNGLLVTHRPDDAVTIQSHQVYRMSGHSPTGTGAPIIETDRAFIDTGCGTIPGAPLTCVSWPGLRVFQSA
jgi:serine/threonine protein phosphatase 1